MSQEIIDAIYECCLVPEFWPDVLDRLAQIAGARGGVLFSAMATRAIPYWVGSPGVRDDLDAYVSGGWLLSDQRQTRLFTSDYDQMFTSDRASFLTEHDLFTPEEIERDPVVQGFFRARGLGPVVITAVPFTPDNWFICSFEREADKGTAGDDIIASLNMFRPHIARSALLSARLEHQRAQTAARLLEALNLPALVFDAQGRVLAANSLIEDPRQPVHWLAAGRIAFSDPRAETMLRNAIETISRGRTRIGSFPVRDRANFPALVAHIIPLHGEARQITVRCAGVLILMPVMAPGAPPVDLIRSLFDLTQAEARVARRIAVGESIDTIAAASAVSRNTVRTHVRGLLEKTGCTRQAEVVALLAGIRQPGGATPDEQDI